MIAAVMAVGVGVAALAGVNHSAFQKGFGNIVNIAGASPDNLNAVVAQLIHSALAHVSGQQNLNSQFSHLGYDI